MTEFKGHSRNIQKGQKRLASEAPFGKDTGMLKIKVRPNKDRDEPMQIEMLRISHIAVATIKQMKPRLKELVLSCLPFDCFGKENSDKNCTIFHRSALLPAPVGEASLVFCFR